MKHVGKLLGNIKYAFTKNYLINDSTSNNIKSNIEVIKPNLNLCKSMKINGTISEVEYANKVSGLLKNIPDSILVEESECAEKHL